MPENAPPGKVYEIRLSRAARRALERDLPPPVAAAMWEFINGDLRRFPHRVGKPLRFELEGLMSARRGQYRIIYRVVDDQLIVQVIKIAHRADAYS